MQRERNFLPSKNKSSRPTPAKAFVDNQQILNDKKTLLC
jgi:hypothetical protein